MWLKVEINENVERVVEIIEIAERCGYSDQHYFSYCFKKYCGMSPNAMRQEKESL